MNIEVTKFPILIIAGQRTGSTELTTQLALKYNLESLMEPRFFKDLPDKLCEYENTQRKDFVLKVMPDELLLYPVVKEISRRSFNIKLTRKNLVEQIASWYIAKSKLPTIDRSNNKVVNRLTNHIFQQKTPTVDPYSVDIDKNKLMLIIKEVLNIKQHLNNCDVKFDLKLQYEDLDLNRTQSGHEFKTTPPDNIEELYRSIRFFLEKLQ